MQQQETTHMDKLTQTQNAIDDLITIMSSTLSYVSRKSSFKQVNPDIPVTQSIPDADSPEVFEASVKELVSDFLRKAKQLEYLISVLPSSDTSPSPSLAADQEDPELEELQSEMMRVNEEYKEVLEMAEILHKELTESLRTALDARAAGPTTFSSV